MSIIISSSALLRQLLLVATVLPKRAIVPATEYVLLRADVVTCVLTLTAYDLETSVSVQLPLDFTPGTESFDALLPLKPLREVLANIPCQPITLRPGAKPAQLELRIDVPNGRDEAGEALGTGAKYVFSADCAAADYPVVPAAPAPDGRTLLTLPGHLLRTALGYVSSLTGADELRPAMTGVHVVADAAGILFEATDGHRLGQYAPRASTEPGYSFEARSHGDEGIGFILPRRALRALSQLTRDADTVHIFCPLASGPLRVELGAGGPVLTIRPIDEKFPDTARIIPTEFAGGVLTLSQAPMLALLRRLRPFVSPYLKNVALALMPQGASQARAENADDDTQGREPLPGTFAGPAPLQIGFNLNFLSPLLSQLPGPRVQLHLQAKDSQSAVLTGQDGLASPLRYLIMPVMSNKY